MPDPVWTAGFVSVTLTEGGSALRKRSLQDGGGGAL